MCKIVYLTSNRFDLEAKRFKNLLKSELEKREIEVVLDSSYDMFNFFKEHKTCGIAIAIDFYKEGSEGRGIVLNRYCSNISKTFAYTLSNLLDELLPLHNWRGINFVKSDNNEWYKFFNKVSSETRVILKLCTKTNRSEYLDFLSKTDKIVESFSEEIIRCLRSDYNYIKYRNKVELSKRKKFQNKYGVVKE